VEEKRDELIWRSTAVFMRLGVKSVTMDDLANELGVSKKTLYKHFEDKNGLVNAIIEEKLELDRCSCEREIEQAENAIDAMLRISKNVMENVGAVNPTVFHDLRKHYPSAWEKLSKHKWDYVYSQFKSNIEQGMKEGLYRDNINADIIAKLYVANTDSIMSGDLFPWPEYEFGKVFLQTIRFMIRGLASDQGIEYFKERIKKETNE